MDKSTEQHLRKYAEKYETASFLEDDPSRYMHLVKGIRNQEAMAFIASSLSYGNRKQFNPKIQMILEWTGGEVDEWIRSGQYEVRFKKGDLICFYRLYKNETMHRFLQAYQQLLLTHGSLGDYVRLHATDGYTAIAAICHYFNNHSRCNHRAWN